MTQATSYQYPRIDERRRGYYQRLAQDPGCRQLVRELTVPQLGGSAFTVEKDQILRVTAIEGPQVADFNAFNKDDPKEMFWSGRTRLLQRAQRVEQVVLQRDDGVQRLQLARVLRLLALPLLLNVTLGLSHLQLRAAR